MSDKTAKPYRRRIIYIEKEFQRGFIIKYCLIALAAMALASGLLYLLSGDTVTATYRMHQLALEKTSDAIMPALVVTNVTVLLVFLALTVFVGLFISFRIGGPLYRFSQDLEFIGQGNLSKRIRLRRDDQLQRFASVINQMTENLEGRVRQLQDLAVQVKAEADANQAIGPEFSAKVEQLHHKAFSLFDQAQ